MLLTIFSEQTQPESLQQVRGFTLVEMLVAVTILSFVMVSVLTIARAALELNSYSESRVLASYLAQDALEYVKSVRDGDYFSRALAPSSWSNNFSILRGRCAVSCIIETQNANLPVTSAVTTCSGTCPFLQYNAATGIYTHTGGQDTTLRRQVKVEAGGEDEYIATVQVVWTEEGVDKMYELKRYIYDLALAKEKAEAALTAKFTP